MSTTNPDGKSEKLTRDLSEPLPIPQEGIDKAIAVLKSGRLFRYGEFDGGQSEVAELEREFAEFMGCKYAVALNSSHSNAPASSPTILCWSMRSRLRQYPAL